MLIQTRPLHTFTMTMSIFPQKAIVLVDPVTEWKQVVQAAIKNNPEDENRRYQIVAVQMTGIDLSENMKQFLPTITALKEAGIDHVISMNQRDVYSCAHELKLLEQRADLIIRGVLPLSEIAVDVSDMIAASLGLPHNRLNLGLSRRDKGFMKETVAQSGLRVPKFARLGGVAVNGPAQTVGDLQRSMARLDLAFPVVVKTPQGFSTTDVFICRSMVEAEDALDAIVGRIGPDGRSVTHALLEEYIGGIEFAVNLMVFREDEFYVTDVWKYEKDQHAQYGSATICNPYDFALADVVSYAKRVAQAVGVRFGAAHVELKADMPDGGNKYTDPVMIEIGARLSGGQKASMTKAAVPNWDPFTALIQSHCGQRSTQSIRTFDFTPQLFVRHIFLPIERTGRIQAIEQLDPSQLKTLYSSSMIVQVGDSVLKTTDITSCAGFVWLVGEQSLVDMETVQIISRFKLVMEELVS